MRIDRKRPLLSVWSVQDYDGYESDTVFASEGLARQWAESMCRARDPKKYEYQEPQEGHDYWITERCIARTMDEVDE